MLVKFDELKAVTKKAFLNLGLTDEQAETCAQIHCSSSADGVESHGMNRIPRFAEYVKKGWINIHGKPELVKAKGAAENYDGNLGIGVINALFCGQEYYSLDEGRNLRMENRGGRLHRYKLDQHRVMYANVGQ